MNPKKLLMALCLILALSLGGCAGRTANPTATALPGDKELDCETLEAEMSHLDAEARRRFSQQSGKTGTNVALGIAGWFLLVPWFFMDFSDAERVEAEAMRDRFRHLQRLYNKQDCDE